MVGNGRDDFEVAYHAWGWVQKLHDQSFHPDICNLPKHDALKHYVLHLAKYARTFMPNDFDPSRVLQVKVDAFIINTAICNKFNLSVSKMMKEAMTLPIIQAEPYYYLDLLQEFSKTTEALDHIEVYNYAEKIEYATMNLFRFLVGPCELGPNHILRLGYERLLQVEKKHFMYESLKAEQFARYGTTVMWANDFETELVYIWKTNGT